MTDLTIGSLFSGYGGLDLAVEDVLDGRTVWVCDVDPGARRILSARFPHAPNLGDIAAVDWTRVPPVDVLTGGFPCQDVSHAGARKGLGPGTRSGLWARMADAVDHLRPALVVFENVRGLLSAEAASDVEPCPWCMGGAGDGEPPLRALGSVLADLADLRYDAAWHGVRAADVGAPHGRFRVFGLAWPAAGDTGRVSVQRRADPRGVAGTPRTGTGEGIQRERRRNTPRDASAATADAIHEARASAGSPIRVGTVLDGCAVPDAAGDGRHERRPESARLKRRPDAAERGTAAADTGREHGQRRPDSLAGSDRRPESADPPELPAAATADTDSDGLSRVWRVDPAERDADGRRSAHVAWGAYEPAIRRWEHTLGRVAPAPTEPGRNGGQRLSSRFVEWMMGLPSGWVTDVPGLSRNDQLKALGNGVVPQQAAAALRILLAWRATAVFADYAEGA